MYIENLTNEELEQFNYIIACLHFYGRSIKPDIEIHDYNTAIEIIKEKLNTESYLRVMEALNKDKYSCLLPGGATALTLKGIEYAKKTFKL